MPEVYRAGEFIPELDGVARGAVSIVCKAPHDLELVYALAEIAPRPPASPLRSFAQSLTAKTINWHEWWLHWLSKGGRIHPLSSADKQGATTPQDEILEIIDSEIETLKQVLSVLYYMWTAHPKDASELACCISIALDDRPSPTLIEWEGNRPALAFGQGSLWVTVGLAAWKARGFLAGLILGGGIDATSRRAGLVKKARAVAVEKVRAEGREEAASLPDIRDLSPAQIGGHELCVLIHGLCSTDVGTFDQFEEEIRRRCKKKDNPNLMLIGFPHDSLTASIETNAKELAQLLIRLNVPNVRLVCHSRGGLVARRAAARLRQEVPAQPWIHSCVTFGTPHLGTSAASAPNSLTASMLALGHLRRSPSVNAVADILCSVESGSTWRGVSELAPYEKEGSYLPLLEKHEDQFNFLDDALPNLNVFGSVGPSQQRRRDWKVRLMERVLGTSEHDLLVPIASSIPTLRRAGGSRLIERTHFEYFSYLEGEGLVAPPFWHKALLTLGLK